MRAGDAIFLLGLFLWVTVAVGPWWVGIALFLAGGAVNYAVHGVPLRNRGKP